MNEREREIKYCHSDDKKIDQMNSHSTEVLPTCNSTKYLNNVGDISKEPKAHSLHSSVIEAMAVLPFLKFEFYDRKPDFHL